MYHLALLPAFLAVTALAHPSPASEFSGQVVVPPFMSNSLAKSSFLDNTQTKPPMKITSPNQTTMAMIINLAVLSITVQI